jgi:hypothetical protein
MKKILLAAMLTFAMTTGSAFAQMMGSGQHMMDAAKQPQVQQGSQHYYGMMGYGMYPGMMSGYGMHPGMMGGYGMPHMYPGTGVNLDTQREFLKETSKLRKKLHDLMFEHMEAQWQADTKPEQLEKLSKEIRGLQQELHEKSREALK